MHIPLSAFRSKTKTATDAKASTEALLLEVLEDGKDLSFRFDLDGVVIDAGKAGEAGGGVLLQGQWVSPYFADVQLGQAAARLVAPLLYRPSRIIFSKRTLTTLRFEHRSIADVMMRNLFGAVWLNVPFQFSHETDRLDKAELKLRADLMRHYLWVVQAISGEMALKSPDIENRLVVNGHFRIFEFDDELLNSGFRIFRDGGDREDNSYWPAAQFEQVRSDMLALFS